MSPIVRRSSVRSFPLVAVAVVAFGVQQARPAEAPPVERRTPGLGLSKETAIEVCGPNGEHGYFDRLLCSDGSVVGYERVGSAGTRNDPTTKADQEIMRTEMMTSAPIPRGQKDFHMVDRFAVECSAGRSFLFVDRYHCPDPAKQGPPPGFSFDESRPSAAPPAETGATGLGLSKTTAVEVCGPNGARDYLDRLRCPNGSPVRFQRRGSMGLHNDPGTNSEEDAARQQSMSAAPIPTGQRDFHLIDGYSADCPSRKSFLYFDAYHCPEPRHQVPPPGFSMAAPGTAK